MARKDVIQLRCTETEKARWQQAAALEHLDVSAWVRNLLNRAAMTQLARNAIQKGTDHDSP
jgi:uncharacterized protein (DUF1778 family)